MGAVECSTNKHSLCTNTRSIDIVDDLTLFKRINWFKWRKKIELNSVVIVFYFHCDCLHLPVTSIVSILLKSTWLITQLNVYMNFCLNDPLGITQRFKFFRSIQFLSTWKCESVHNLCTYGRKTLHMEQLTKRPQRSLLHDSVRVKHKIRCWHFCNRCVRWEM